MTNNQEREPFSFGELLEATNDSEQPPSPEFVTASDGIRLAVRIYKPSTRASAVLVFYHGGGAHSGAGYQLLGQGLANKYNIKVYTPDLRGHGLGEGPRGDTPSVEQMMKDVNVLLEYARDEKLPLYLGGHSSGGGFVVNYSSWSERIHNVDAYVLVSPQLGHTSGTNRPSENFASVAIWAFIVNGIFGTLGNYKAVQFNYPKQVLEQDALLVKYNTVNMANAITPESPQAQFESMSIPVGMWVGGDDELFVPEKVVEYAHLTKTRDSFGKIVQGQNHLGILVGVHEEVGQWILDLTGKR